MPESERRSFYRAGALGAALPLIGMLVVMGVMIVLGPRPASAPEYFAIFEASPIEMVLRGDLLIVVLIVAPYFLLAPALYVALRVHAPFTVALAAGATLAGTIGAIVSEPTLSMLALSQRHAAAGDATERLIAIAAGEAVLARDLWHGTAAFAGGILLQGSGVVFAVIMLRSPSFRRVTALSGIAANGLDLFQHFLHPFSPGIAGTVQAWMGLAYLVAFATLAQDLARLGRTPSLASARGTAT